MGQLGGSGDLLLGRDAERARLDAAVDDALAGRATTVLVAGEAGIGKSALVDAATRRAESLGCRVGRGEGVSLTIEQPLGPVLAALARLGVSAAPRDRTLLESSIGDATTMLLQRTIASLDRVVGGEPTVLVLEDLHWADRPTLTFVHHLATRANGSQLALIATARPGLPGSSVQHLLAGLVDHVVVLHGLDEDAVEELATRRSGGSLDPRLRGPLNAADGNPLLVQSLVEGFLATGDAGTAEGNPNAPIAAQVSSLPATTLRVAQVAALMAGPLQIDVLAAVLSLAPGDVMEALDHAVIGGVLRRAGDAVEFRHDLHRSACLATLPATAQAALHLQIADVLSALGSPELAVAEHIARGARRGNRDAVARLTATASHVVGYDAVTALRISDLAVGLLGQPVVPPELQVVRVAALAASGQPAEADLLGRALLRTPLDGPTESRIRRDLALAAFVDGRAADSAMHLTRAVALAPDAFAAAKARTELAWAQFLGLNKHEALTGTELGVAHGDNGTRTMAFALQCWLGLWNLDVPLARTAALEVVDLVASAPPGDWHIVQPLLAAGAVSLEIGDLATAADVARRGRALAHDVGGAWALPAHDALLAAVHLRRGALGEAAECSARALEGTALVDGFGIELWSRAQLARIALWRGDDATAEHHIEAAQLAAGDGRAQFGMEHLAIAEATFEERRGDLAAGFATLNLAWDLLSAIGVLYVRAPVGAALVRAGVLVGDESRAAEVGAALRDDAMSGLPSIVAEAERAEAWVARSPEAARAAVDAARSTEQPLLLFDVLTEMAQLLRERDASAAGQYAAEALALATGHGIAVSERPGRRTAAKRTPRPTFGVESLSDAERRVADLVVQGFTNTEIAGKLVVSRRTVDTQVLAAYRKLGVRSRVELTRVLLDA